MASNFWANENATAKRKYRYVLKVQKTNKGVGPTNTKFESWLISKVTRPSFSITEATHAYLNHTFYFPGRLTWNDVSFTVIDSVNPDSQGQLMGMLAASGYQLPRNIASPAGKGTIDKASSIVDVQIESIDAGGATIDRWTLKNAWILSANLGEYDYSADDLMSFDVTLKYDYATYNVIGGTGGLNEQERKQLNKVASSGNE